MSEELHLPATKDKGERYAALLPQIRSLIDGEPDLVANLANVTAALREAFGFFWVGWYLMKSGELVLGPFQGPLACTRIAIGKGVCGTAAAQAATIVVEDGKILNDVTVNQLCKQAVCQARAGADVVAPSDMMVR